MIDQSGSGRYSVKPSFEERDLGAVQIKVSNRQLLEVGDRLAASETMDGVSHSPLTWMSAPELPLSCDNSACNIFVHIIVGWSNP